MAGAGSYDLAAALDVLMPGVVIQRNLMDAASNAWTAKNFLPLQPSDVLGILSAANALDPSTVQPRYAPTTQGPYTTLPVYPTLLPRFPDSNEDPRDGWVKYGLWETWGTW